ncbi:MAG: NUDIX domain-containing protein [Actinomycetaceae bacterium]|nr:NUDIX domain-containing protein [Actinomycetaceae bacterium]
MSQQNLVVAAAIMAPQSRSSDSEAVHWGTPAAVDEPRILAAQRAYPENLRGQYELPGGKVHPGEDPIDALHREIAEELDCLVTLKQPVIHPHSPDGSWPILGGRRMRVWLAHAVSEPRAGTDHLQLTWCSPTSYQHLPWLTPNIPIVQAAFALCE